MNAILLELFKEQGVVNMITDFKYQFELQEGLLKYTQKLKEVQETLKEVQETLEKHYYMPYSYIGWEDDDMFLIKQCGKYEKQCGKYENLIEVYQDNIDNIFFNINL